MRRILIGSATALAGVLLAAGPAAADIHGKTNFAGNCSLTGTTTFASPVTALGGTNSLTLSTDDGHGELLDDGTTCTGDLRYGVVPKGNRTWRVRTTGSGTGLISCMRSDIPSANLAMEFLNDDGTPVTHDGSAVADGGIPLVLRLQSDIRGATRDMVLTIRGGGSGRYPNGTNAEGFARFLPTNEQIQSCGGAGFTSLAFEAVMATGPSQRFAGRAPVTNTALFTPDNVLLTR